MYNRACLVARAEAEVYHWRNACREAQKITDVIDVQCTAPVNPSFERWRTMRLPACGITREQFLAALTPEQRAGAERTEKLYGGTIIRVPPMKGPQS
jgi:hypothetical protein